jgi:hypothetical protein
MAYQDYTPVVAHARVRRQGRWKLGHYHFDSHTRGGYDDATG